MDLILTFIAAFLFGMITRQALEARWLAKLHAELEEELKRSNRYRSL